MAIIVCPECGKRFSDKAKECPECGCPTEYVLAQEHEAQADSSTKQTIPRAIENKISTVASNVSSNNESEAVERFLILGRQLVVTKKLDKFLEWSAALTQLSWKYKQEIGALYLSSGNLDKLLEQLPEQIAETTDGLLEAAVSILVSAGVYDLDKAAFYKKHKEAIDPKQIIEPLVERYLQISNLADEVEAYHENIKQIHRHVWSGGGFGISGAIKGAIKAELLNIGSSFLLSFSDNAKAREDYQRISNAKKQIYESEWARNSVTSAFSKIFFGILDSVTEELIRVGVFEKGYFNKAEAIRIINNLYTSFDRLSDDIRRDMCQKAFFAYPTYYETFKIIFLIGADDSGDVERLAKRLGYYNYYLEDVRRIIFSQNYDRIMELEEKTAISTDKELKAFFTECQTFESETNYDLTELYRRAVDSRLRFPVSEEKAKYIIRWIDDIFGVRPGTGGAFRDHEKEEMISKVKERAAQYDATFDAYDNQRLISETVKTVCVDFSKKWLSEDFSFYNKTDIRRIRNYRQYETYAEIPKDAELYALFGLCAKPDDAPSYVIAIADKGIFVSAEHGSVCFSRTWKEFLTQLYGKNVKGLVFGDTRFSLFFNDDIDKLLSTIRNQLQIALNLKQGGADSAVARSGNGQPISYTRDEVRNSIVFSACEDFSSRKHWPIHQFGVKKSLKKSDRYIDYLAEVNAPEGTEFYYIYSRRESSSWFETTIAVTDYGLMYSDHFTKKTCISWNDFQNMTIQAPDKNRLCIGEYECTLPGESAFVCALLNEIKNRLIECRNQESKKVQSKVNASVSEGAYACDPGYRGELASLLRELNLFDVFSCHESDLGPVISQYDPKFQDAIRYCIDSDQKKQQVRVLAVIPHIKQLFVFTDDYFIGKTTQNRILILAFSSIIDFYFKSENGSALLALCVDNDGKPLELFFSAASTLLNANTKKLKDLLYQQFPFNFATRFRLGSGVERNNEKALQLYELAWKDESLFPKCCRGMALIYESIGDFQKAYDSYNLILCASGNCDSEILSWAVFCYKHKDLYLNQAYRFDSEDYFNVLDYLYELSQKNIAGAREQLLLVLSDREWCKKAEEAANELGEEEVKRLKEIVSRARMIPRPGEDSSPKKGLRSLFGRR